jgi:hypothetical protein
MLLWCRAGVWKGSVRDMPVCLVLLAHPGTRLTLCIRHRWLSSAGNWPQVFVCAERCGGRLRRLLRSSRWLLLATG